MSEIPLRFQLLRERAFAQRDARSALLELVHEALSSKDAALVFADVAAEAGWAPTRPRKLLADARDGWTANAPIPESEWLTRLTSHLRPGRNPRKDRVLGPEKRVLRAAAAELLFGEWLPHRWPVPLKDPPDDDNVALYINGERVLPLP